MTIASNLQGTKESVSDLEDLRALKARSGTRSDDDDEQGMRGVEKWRRRHRLQLSRTRHRWRRRNGRICRRRGRVGLHVRHAHARLMHRRPGAATFYVTNGRVRDSSVAEWVGQA